MWKGDIEFYRKRRDLTHISVIIYMVDKVYQKFWTQNNDTNNSTFNQSRMVKYLCPLQIWSHIITRMESYPEILEYSPVNIYWVNKYRTTIKSHKTIKTVSLGALYFVEDLLDFSHKDVEIQSLQSGF